MAQACGSQKEGEVFEAQNTLIINLSILAFLKNLPGLPVVQGTCINTVHTAYLNIPQISKNCKI